MKARVLYLVADCRIWQHILILWLQSAGWWSKCRSYWNTQCSPQDGGYPRTLRHNPAQSEESVSRSFGPTVKVVKKGIFLNSNSIIKTNQQCILSSQPTREHRAFLKDQSCTSPQAAVPAAASPKGNSSNHFYLLSKEQYHYFKREGKNFTISLLYRNWETF